MLASSPEITSWSKMLAPSEAILFIVYPEKQEKGKKKGRDGNTIPPDVPPEKSVFRSRSKLELDMEQQTGSKSGKEYVKAIYCQPAYFSYMQSTSCKMLGWMRHKLESRLPGEISIISETQMISLLCRK